MTATGHAVVGTALAALIPNPAIGIPVAILSHVLADAFPHWDTGTNIKKKSKNEFVIGSFIDLGLSFVLPFILAIFLFPSINLIYLYSMVIAAQAIDWATAPYIFLHWKFFPFSWFYWLQGTFDNRLDKPKGIIYQVGILIVLLFVAVIVPKLS